MEKNLVDLDANETIVFLLHNNSFYKHLHIPLKSFLEINPNYNNSQKLLFETITNDLKAKENKIRKKKFEIQIFVIADKA